MSKYTFKSILKKVFNVYYKIFLAILAIIFITTFLALMLNDITGKKYSAFGIASDSMNPLLYKYDLIINEKKDEYKVGDVITFKAGEKKETYTHRITQVKENNRGEKYITKGDANSVEDTWLVDYENISGAMIFSFKYAGFFISFLNSIGGIIAFVIIPANSLLTLLINDFFSKKDSNEI